MPRAHVCRVCVCVCVTRCAADWRRKLLLRQLLLGVVCGALLRVTWGSSRSDWRQEYGPSAHSSGRSGVVGGRSGGAAAALLSLPPRSLMSFSRSSTVPPSRAMKRWPCEGGEVRERGGYLSKADGPSESEQHSSNKSHPNVGARRVDKYPNESLAQPMLAFYTLQVSCWTIFSFPGW